MTRALAISGATFSKAFAMYSYESPWISVTPYALIVQPAGYGVMISQLIMVAVKRSIEACDLGQRGEFGQKRTDRRQVVGLMKWRKRREPLQTCNHTMVNQYGAIIVGTTMDDPMPDSEWTELKFVPQPCACDQQGSRNI